MSELLTCASCGKSFPANVLGEEMAGGCPHCLARLALRGEKTVILTEASDSEAIPSEFGPYQIEGLIGRGGMGSVYLAKQTTLDRLVAIKFLPESFADEPELVARFHREARTLAKLSHPHIVAVHDVGEIGGRCYLVMEHIDGVTLRSLIEARELTPAQALPIVGQICEALQFAHDEGVVHRDIKPENVMIDRHGRVKVADFGLAKLIGDKQQGPALTGTRAVMGTPHYMAPEQVESSREIDHRADLYSLGVLFYELLTGELPLGRFEPPSQKVSVDIQLDAVVLRALEKSPERRYQAASQIKQDIERCSDAPKPAQPGPSLDELLLGPEAIEPGWALSTRYRGRALPHVATDTTDLYLMLTAYGAYGKPSGVSCEHLSGGYIAGLSPGSGRRGAQIFLNVFEFTDAEAQQRMSRYLRTKSRPSRAPHHAVLEGPNVLAIGHLYQCNESGRLAFERVLDHLRSNGLKETFRSPLRSTSPTPATWRQLAMAIVLLVAFTLSFRFCLPIFDVEQPQTPVEGKAQKVADPKATILQVWRANGPLSAPVVFGDQILVVNGAGRLLRDGKPTSLPKGMLRIPPTAVGGKLYLGAGEQLGLLVHSSERTIPWVGAFDNKPLDGFAIDPTGRAWGHTGDGKLWLASKDRLHFSSGSSMNTHTAVHPETGGLIEWRTDASPMLTLRSAPTGKHIWTRNGLAAPPALFPQAIVMAIKRYGKPLTILAVDPKRGRTIWAHPAEVAQITEIIGEGDTAYVLGYGNKAVTVITLDVSTGKQQSRWTIPLEWSINGAAACKGVIYGRHSHRRGLSAIDLTGSSSGIAWTWTTNTDISVPVISKGRVIVSGKNGEITLLKAVHPDHDGWGCARADAARTNVRR